MGVSLVLCNDQRAELRGKEGCFVFCLVLSWKPVLEKKSGHMIFLQFKIKAEEKKT